MHVHMQSEIYHNWRVEQANLVDPTGDFSM